MNYDPYATRELFMGQFCVTRSNPTHQLTDPTQLNPVQLTVELTVDPANPTQGSTHPQWSVDTSWAGTRPMGQPAPWTTPLGVVSRR